MFCYILFDIFDNCAVQLLIIAVLQFISFKQFIAGYC